MPKYTDVIRDAIIANFEAGDQPTAANFADWILAVQEGIELHDHSGTGDGDGVADLVGPVGIGVPAPGVMLDLLGAHVAGVGVARFTGDAASGFMSLDTTTGGAGDEGGFLINLGGVVKGQFGAKGDDTVYIKNRVFGAANIITLTSAGYVGIGIETPDRTLHVHTATAGAVVPAGSGDDLVVENDADGGISILTPDADDANLFFGSPGDSVGALMRWSHDADLFIIGTAKAGADVSIVTANIAEAIRLTSVQRVGFSQAVPTGRIHAKIVDALAIPVLVLEQLDISEGTINFVASDRGVITGATNSLESVRVEVNGVVRRIAVYADA